MPDRPQNPTSGWTGGQYSVWRAGLAAVVAGACVQWWVGGELVWPVVIGGWCAALCLAVGWFDRAAALALLAGMGWVCAVRGYFDASDVPAAFCLCVHLATPPSPYGALSARGRGAPAGRWAMPAAVGHAAWLLVVLLVALFGVVLWQQGRVTLAVVLVAYVPAVLVAPLRPWAWCAVLVLMVCAAGYQGYAGRLRVLELGLVWVHLLCADPAWLKPKRAGQSEWLFYDGACGLCHAAVRFVLAEDRAGDAFRFAPIGGGAFERELSEAQRAGLPDSVVVLTEAGAVLTRSRAVAHMLTRLGGLWRVCGWLLWWVPRPLRDGGYVLLAKVRRRLLKAPADPCPVGDAELRERFDLRGKE